MKWRLVVLAGLISMIFGSGFSWGESVPLKFKVYRNWDLILPKEQSKRVSGDIMLQGMGKLFRTGISGTTLEIDRTGDGVFDVKIGGESGIVTLQGETTGGEKLSYALRLRNSGAGWHALPGGAAVGKINGQQIRIIDQNLNGRFDDYGKDALIVGRGKHAGFLSRVIQVRGQLYTIDVASNGATLTGTPFTGEQGTLDFTTKFTSKGKLLGTVVVSADNAYSFVVRDKPMAVPAGDYQIRHGRIGLGRNVVTFTRGKTETLRVTAGGTTTLALGEPITIDFSYVRQPGRVIMTPQLVSYTGQGGEHYDQWTPFGGSPQFDVRDVETGKQIALAVFGGC